MSAADQNFRDDERLHLNDRNVNINMKMNMEYRVNKRTGDKISVFIHCIDEVSDWKDYRKKKLQNTSNYKLR